MLHYYTEPEKVKHQWQVKKILAENQKTIQTIPFHTEKLAWEFLNWKHITINGVECYAGV